MASSVETYRLLLSSSVNPQEKERAAANKDVSAYMEKPLTKEAIERLTKKS